jgi:hypothetical protein
MAYKKEIGKVRGKMRKGKSVGGINEKVRRKKAI